MDKTEVTKSSSHHYPFVIAHYLLRWTLCVQIVLTTLIYPGLPKSVVEWLGADNVNDLLPSQSLLAAEPPDTISTYLALAALASAIILLFTASRTLLLLIFSWNIFQLFIVPSIESSHLHASTIALLARPLHYMLPLCLLMLRPTSQGNYTPQTLRSCHFGIDIARIGLGLLMISYSLLLPSIDQVVTAEPSFFESLWETDPTYATTNNIFSATFFLVGLWTLLQPGILAYALVAFAASMIFIKSMQQAEADSINFLNELEFGIARYTVPLILLLYSFAYISFRSTKRSSTSTPTSTPRSVPKAKASAFPIDKYS